MGTLVVQAADAGAAPSADALAVGAKHLMKQYTDAFCVQRTAALKPGTRNFGERWTSVHLHDLTVSGHSPPSIPARELALSHSHLMRLESLRHRRR